MFKVVLPNKGSLAEGAMNLFNLAGYCCKSNSKELICYDKKNQIEFVFLRPKDIATYVDAGIFDLGITGRDIVRDSDFDLCELMPLGFGKSAMYFIIPNERDFSSVEQFAGVKIACSYPRLLEKYLQKKNIKSNIIKLDGAVEVSIHLGIADVIVDVVETGTTIKEAGLKTVGESIIKSEAILIGTKVLEKLPEQAQKMVLRLQGVITAKNYIMIEYDIKKELLEEACALCRGIYSPTLTQLHNKDWFSVKVMATKVQENVLIDQLYELGAKGIVVTALTNCRI